MASVKDYKDKTEAELKAELLNLRKEQFNLRMQQAAGQMSQHHQFRNVRKDIARLKTVMTEKTMAGKAS